MNSSNCPCKTTVSNNMLCNLKWDMFCVVMATKYGVGEGGGVEMCACEWGGEQAFESHTTLRPVFPHKHDRTLQVPFAIMSP